MRMLSLMCLALAFAACDNDVKGTGTYTSNFVPSAIVDAQLFPLTVPIFPQAPNVVCPAGRAFNTAFDFVITSARPVSLDSARVQMIDGTSLGPTLTFPPPEINRLFGSTIVIGTRTFPFRPAFGCVPVLPTAIAVEAVLIEQSGATRTVRARADVK